jgi:hypothetical protein
MIVAVTAAGYFISESIPVFGNGKTVTLAADYASGLPALSGVAADDAGNGTGVAEEPSFVASQSLANQNNSVRDAPQSEDANDASGNETVRVFKIPAWRTQTPVKYNITIDGSDDNVYMVVVSAPTPSPYFLYGKEAGELGVAALVDVFGMDPIDKTFNMTFKTAGTQRRAFWEGVWYGEEQGASGHMERFYFEVDAVNGEILQILHERVPDEEFEIDPQYDAELNFNSSDEYANLAKETALKFNAVNGEVKTVTYESQGIVTMNNEQFFTLNVTGVNGEQAQLSFSRHDNALLGIIYDAGIREVEKRLLQEGERRSRFCAVPSRVFRYGGQLTKITST